MKNLCLLTILGLLFLSSTAQHDAILGKWKFKEVYNLEKFDSMGIRQQLDNLKPEQRIIIDLAYFNGFTQEEIAKQIGIPLGTVKTRMRSAILELRRILH